jgi:signal transduction histidine kinase/CheY-like chemotaxis protein
VTGAFALAITWAQLRSAPALLRVELMVMTLALAAVGWAGFLPASVRVRVLLLHGGFATIVVVASLVTGSAPGSLGCATLLSLLAAFLIGPRPALVVTTAAAGWLLVAGFIHQAWPQTFGVSFGTSDLDSATNWTRAGFTVLTLMVVGVVAMVEYLRNLTRALADGRAALDAAVAEEARRHEAVIARGRAEAELRRTQGLQALAKVGGGFAHELSNRLTVVRAELDSLAMRGEAATPPVVQEAVTDMVGAIEGAGAVLRRLLVVSGQDIVRAVDSTDLAELVEDARKQLAGVDGLRVVVEAEAHVTALVDRASLQGVFLNLAINARDAMGEGGTLLLRVRSATDDERTATGCSAAIDVVDAGPGMDSATMARLFEPFFTTKGVRGTGLGLLAARRVVEAAGGVLRVASAPGRGTTFTILLPHGTPLGARQEPAASAPVTARGVPVLVVDDDEAVRKAWKRALARHGVRVLEASDVDEAIAIARREPIALAWMDAVMPGRPTRELIEELRVLQPRAHLVICSGHVEEELLRRDLLLGGVDFVRKPCSVQDLVDRARRAAGAAAAIPS